MGARRFFLAAASLIATSFLVVQTKGTAAAEGTPAAQGDAAACAAVKRAAQALGEAERFHSKLLARTPGRRRPKDVEQVVLGDVVYASSPASGRWVKLPLTAEGRRALSASIVAYPPRDCRDGGAAETDGVATRVYEYTQVLPVQEGAPSTAQGRLWVDVADGRPRRYEGQHGEVRVVLTIGYDAVEPPFGK
ncbi:hypothetical protein GCM10009416_32210 [Craurococcus roseus]|uniref:Uncharacterized protein n=1 Tax=Craurococcus roseus TaxID=77585 RepID=A0ABN1FI62_9PROT